MAPELGDDSLLRPSVDRLSAGKVTQIESSEALIALDAAESVGRATARLHGTPHGVAVVLGEDGRLVGTLSDCDIRLALLAGYGTDSPVRDVMSARTVTAGPSAGDAEVLDLLQSHRLRALPIVDERGHVLEMRTLDQAATGPPPVAVIMAGGRGLRLRPVTDTVPKPLLRLGSKTIIERMITGVAAAGAEHVYLAVKYKAEAFHERLGDGAALGVQLHYLHEESPLGTAGALSLLPPQEGPIVVTNGDIVTTVDFARMLDFHWRHGGAMTVAGATFVSHVPYGILDTCAHHLLSIEEKPDRSELCNAGMYVLEPHVLRLLSDGTHADMPDLIASVLAAGMSVNVFPILEKWFDIGGPAEFERILVQFATGEET